MLNTQSYDGTSLYVSFFFSFFAVSDGLVDRTEPHNVTFYCSTGIPLRIQELLYCSRSIFIHACIRSALIKMSGIM